MPVHALINFRWRFSSVFARWCHRPRLAGGHARLRFESNLIKPLERIRRALQEVVNRFLIGQFVSV